MDVREAVSIGVQFMKDLYKGQEIPDLQLEEVELTDDEAFWLITFSFSRPAPATHALDMLRAPNYERAFKILKIDSRNARVLSMKIRSA